LANLSQRCACVAPDGDEADQVQQVVALDEVAALDALGHVLPPAPELARRGVRRQLVGEQRRLLARFAVLPLGALLPAPPEPLLLGQLCPACHDPSVVISHSAIQQARALNTTTAAAVTGRPSAVVNEPER
jgi:hypothetical protein